MIGGKSDGVKPELRFISASANMDVCRLVLFVAEKEKAKPPDA
jgi:hypothetical protein